MSCGHFVSASAFNFTRGAGISRAERLANGLAFYHAWVAARAAKVAGNRSDAGITCFDGEYDCEIDPSWLWPRADGGGNYTRAAAFVIDCPLVLLGKGSQNAIFNWYPTGEEGGSGPEFDWSAIISDWTLEDAPVTMEGISWNGDLVARADRATDWDTRSTSGIWVQGRTDADYTSALRLYDVHATGHWNGVVNSSQSRGLLEVDRCDLKASSAAIFWFPGDTDGARMHITASNIRQDADEGSTTGIGIYVHPSVSTRIVSTNFYSTARQALYHNGTPTTVPEYAEVIGCYFDSTCGFGIQSNKNIDEIIVGSRFACEQRAIVLQQGGNISGCEFDGGTDHIVSAFISDTDQDVVVHGCTFNVDAAAQSGVISATGGRWAVSDCTIRTSLPTVLMRLYDGASAHIQNVELIQTAGGPWSSVAIGIDDDLDITFSNVRFGSQVGIDFGDAGTPSNLARVKLRGCRFGGGTTYGNFLLNGMAAASSGVLSMEDCELTDGEGIGLFECESGLWQRIGFRAARNPDPVTAAVTTVLSPNYNYDVVTGTATITNLRVLVNTLAVTRLFQGERTIEADGAGVTLDGAGGEIRLLGGAASRTLDDGERVRLYFDPVDGLVKEL